MVGDDIAGEIYQLTIDRESYALCIKMYKSTAFQRTPRLLFFLSKFIYKSIDTILCRCYNKKQYRGVVSAVTHSYVNNHGHGPGIA